MKPGSRSLTRDLGLAIRDYIEGRDFVYFIETDDGKLVETVESSRIEAVDVSDPNNLVVHTDTGYVFRVRITLGE